MTQVERSGSRKESKNGTREQQKYGTLQTWHGHSPPTEVQKERRSGTLFRFEAVKLSFFSSFSFASSADSSAARAGKHE
jgi:hypothetical protein